MESQNTDMLPFIFFQKKEESTPQKKCVWMTFVTVSFISLIVSLRQPLSLGNNQKSQGPTSGL